MLRLRKLILIEFRTYLKNSLTFFFSFIFPVFLMVVIMSTTGNPKITDDYRLINKYMIISLIVGLVPLALMSFSISVAADQEFGIIDRLKLFGIKQNLILTAKLIANSVVIIFQLLLITIVACLFGFKFPTAIQCTIFLICYFLTALSLFIIGWIIALTFKKIGIVQVVGMTLMFIILTLSGAFGEFGDFPEVIDKICYFIPTYDLSSVLTSYLLGESVDVAPIIGKYIIYNISLLLLVGLLSIRIRNDYRYYGNRCFRNIKKRTLK